MRAFVNFRKHQERKFYGSINFLFCKIQFKDVLIQLGLCKALKVNISNMDSEK